MKGDPILKDIRKFRDELSERYSGDTTPKNPRVLVYPDEISAKTMNMMDQFVDNLKYGKASKAVDLNE